MSYVWGQSRKNYVFPSNLAQEIIISSHENYVTCQVNYWRFSQYYRNGYVWL